MSRSSHTPAAQGSKWIRPSTRWAIYYRDDFMCAYCGHIGKLSLDHVRHVEGHGRDNSPKNLVTCCVPCNSTKKTLSKRQWYAQLRRRGYNVRAIRERIGRLVRIPIDRLRGAVLARHDDTEAERAELGFDTHESILWPAPGVG